MLRSPPPIETYRPWGRPAFRKRAARRCPADPAGRGPSATWRSAVAQARFASKRSTLGVGTVGAGRASSGTVPFEALSLDRNRSNPVEACQSSSAPRTSWTPSAQTSSRGTRTDAAELVVRGDRLEQPGELLLGGPAAGRDVLGRHLVRRRLVAAEDLPRDRLAMDLVGAVVEPRPARIAVHRLERQVGRVAQRAVRLERAVDH